MSAMSPGSRPQHPSGPLQITSRKSVGGPKAELVLLPQAFPDTISWWIEQYFRIEVSTAPSSRKVQAHDLALFRDYLIEEERTEKRLAWTPRLTRAFQDHLRRTIDEHGGRRWRDRTINRVLAHLKTFGKWVHKLAPFPLGSPTEKLKLLPTTTGLEVDRAITPAERRRILDAADVLVQTGGRSRDRSRFRGAEARPQRKTYRPWRNRAIVYALIETGMRRQAIAKLNVSDVDAQKKSVTVEEKGGLEHTYQISKEGLAAVTDYIAHERDADDRRWHSPALFLAAPSVSAGAGRLTPHAINGVWNEVCATAGVHGRTPHSARHAMGKHIIEKTGNIAAVQRQLGHRNAGYSMQYTRVTDQKLHDVIDDR